MRIVVSGLAALTFLLAAAHFLRLGLAGPVLACATLALLAILGRQAWLRPVLAAALAAAAVLWLEVATGLVAFRLAAGLPWMRLAVILGTVAGLTATASMLLAGGPGRQVFARDAGQALPRAAAGLLAFACLAAVQLLPPPHLPPLLLAERFLPSLGWFQALLLSLYAAWACGRLLDPATAPATRARIWLLFSAVFFGQLFLGLAGVPHMLMTGKLHLPVPALIAAGPLYRGEGFFMLGLFLASVLLVGPGWCSHLCYIGAWDAGFSRLGPVQPERPWMYAGAVRAGLAVMVLGAAAGLRAVGLPVAMAAWTAGLFGLGGVVVMAWASRRSRLAAMKSTGSASSRSSTPSAARRSKSEARRRSGAWSR